MGFYVAYGLHAVGDSEIQLHSYIWFFVAYQSHLTNLSDLKNEINELIWTNMTWSVLT